MITRGVYFGEIIDELAAISTQIRMRCKLGFTDLNIYAENFCRDILNALLTLDLTNLNAERSNEPGLDLGDASEKIGFQITSIANVEKVNGTLKKVTPPQLTRYKKIVVFVLGKRQGSYALNQALCDKCDFTDEDIWDWDTVARKALDLDIDKLQKLHRIIRSNVAKLKIELEIPDDEGKYPTTGYDLWEQRLKPKPAKGSSFAKFRAAELEEEYSREEDNDVAKEWNSVARRLSRLPRITREFLVMLIERREPKKSRRFMDAPIHLLYDKIKREYRGDDLDTELGILVHADFVVVDFDDIGEQGPPEISVRISNEFDVSSFFLDFLKKKNLSVRKVIGEIDFSAF